MLGAAAAVGVGGAADAANGQRILGGNYCLFEYTRQFRVTY